MSCKLLIFPYSFYLSRILSLNIGIFLQRKVIIAIKNTKVSLECEMEVSKYAFYAAWVFAILLVE